MYLFGADMEMLSKNETKLALIKSANCIFIHSGNILYELLQTSDEICKAFCGVVNKWIEKESCATIDQCAANTLSITSLPSNESLQDSRNDLKITVKLFLQEHNYEIIDDAIKKVMEDLQCERIDTVLLSFPPSSTSLSKFQNIKFNEYKDIWLRLQNFVKRGIVLSLGVCNFDLESLKDLHQCSDVKPVVNQICTDLCCSLPQELVAFSSSCNIELLTHNDPTNILPSETLQHILPPSNDDQLWKATYLLKYSCVVKLREVVKSKGYILCMKRFNQV